MSDLKILIPTGPTVALNPDHTLRKVYEAIFGRIDRIPVQQAAPIVFQVKDNLTVEAYLLDLRRLTPAEYSRLVTYYWKRFDVRPDEARTIITTIGVPLRADGVVLERSE